MEFWTEMLSGAQQDNAIGKRLHWLQLFRYLKVKDYLFTNSSATAFRHENMKKNYVPDQ